MIILIVKDFMKVYNLKTETKNDSDLQRVYKYNIHPKGSKISSDRGFVNIDNRQTGGSHWVCL